MNAETTQDDETRPRGGLDRVRAFEQALRATEASGSFLIAAGTDGRAVTLDDLTALLDVYEAACRVREADEIAVELGVGIAVEDRDVYNAVADMYEAVDRTRSPR